jgi:hypothetical protein
LEQVFIDGGVVSLVRDGVAPFVFSLSEVSGLVLWRRDEGTDHALRGHGYLLVRDGAALLVRLSHGVVDHAQMMALHARASALLVPSSGVGKIRAWTCWFEPSGRWSFTMDAGAVEAALCGRPLVDLPGPDRSAPGPSDLPEAFLRDPVGALVERVAGSVVWPASWRGAELCPRFASARSGDLVVVSGCRYGSVHAGGGQDRTAAVMLSTDGGLTFVELPWTLPLSQRMTPSGQWCWPPEQLDRVHVAPGDDGPVVRVEWDDPWIDWEPGDEWQATWDPVRQLWRMATRS